MSELFTHGYALLIGVDENQVSRWALPDIAKDLLALRQVLAHPDRCAYPADNVRVLKGSEATQGGILDGLDWLKARIQADPEATAVVYYSGHGWRDTAATPPQFYLIPCDAREDRLCFTALRAADFAAQIAALDPPRLLVMLDCCHAAGMGMKSPLLPGNADALPGEGPGVRDWMPSGHVPAAIPPSLLMSVWDSPLPRAGEGPGVRDAKGLGALAQGRGRAMLSSSSGEQSSYMRADRQMSAFTCHLIEALTGHAEPKEGAQEVLVSDVMGHVTRRVPETVQKEQGKTQTPDFQVSGNFSVALLLGGKGLGKGMQPPDPLAPLPAASRPAAGLSVGRDLINTGNLVAGDQTIQGDFVQGDKIGGDKTTVGDITGSTGVAIGRGARAAVTQRPGGDELARMFAGIYRQIESRSPDPNVDRHEIADKVKLIEQEVNKGEAANAHKVERWLGFLAGMAGDIFDVTAACLTSPAAGIAQAIKKVAAKARAERS